MPPPQAPMPGITQSQRQDKVFISQAIQENLGEIELAKLALKKSSNANVRQFAERMVSDHTRMNNQMELIAHRLEVDIPTEPGKDSRKQKKKLESLSEPQFDRSYAKTMVTNHKRDLREYQRESTSAQDPQLRAAAAQGAGIVRQHLSMAEKLRKSQRPVT